MTRFAAVVKTNIEPSKLDEQFMKRTSERMAELFKSDAKNIVLEVHGGVKMMRGGVMDSAMNIDVHHNSDDLCHNTRISVAEELATFMFEQTKIPKDRTLVLFFDTRKCS